MIALAFKDDAAQLYWVDPDTGSPVQRELPQESLLTWFGERPPEIVVMESKRSSHAWARRLTRQGHTVRLLPARAVRPHVFGTDSGVQGVWTASQWPEAANVPIKSEGEQVATALGNLKAHLAKMRDGVLDELQAMLHELREPAARTRSIEKDLLTSLRGKDDDELPVTAIQQLPELLHRLEEVNREVERFELSVRRQVRAPNRSRR